jgi:EAL domain-containing protein (putative c-di-GMP-specific phosphodiesterase class I)
VDDFGTRYSNLSRLAHIPIGELKIDRSFMDDIEKDAGALAIATTVVRVGQGLGVTVLAEGVETEGHAQDAYRTRMRGRSRSPLPRWRLSSLSAG